MIRIQNLSLALGEGMDQLQKKAAAQLGLRPEQLLSFSLARQSIDARKKGDIHYVCAVDLSAPHEEELVARANSRWVSLLDREEYQFPPVRRNSSLPPVVVGMGPAGLFAALFLAQNGLPPILLERGQPVERRVEDVARFWSTGLLDPSSNVQFGEGGAGTFSDGKLTTGTHDRRIRTVLETLVAAGAPEDILYQQKPHIGTDRLRQVVQNLRARLLELGCDIRFGHRLEGLRLQSGRIIGIQVSVGEQRYSQGCDTVILAPGHSARDTFSMLAACGIPLAPKPFAIGVRIEHRQEQINRSQYGPVWDKLPPADYKLACHLPNGRSAFTFCVCPGGQVVAAASEPGHLVTNGMSSRARDGDLINGGLLVGVTPEDFGDDPLAGVRFQAQWERAAFRLGGGGYLAPAQTVADFLAGVPSRSIPNQGTSYLPGVVPTDLSRCLPGFVVQTLRQALPLLDQKLRGFADPYSVLTGVETRSSSPVRILRGKDLQSPIRGLYPCGEGAGYAGGIMSAAVDGIKVAESVAAPALSE